MNRNLPPSPSVTIQTDYKDRPKNKSHAFFDESAIEGMKAALLVCKHEQKNHQERNKFCNQWISDNVMETDVDEKKVAALVTAVGRDMNAAVRIINLMANEGVTVQALSSSGIKNAGKVRNALARIFNGSKSAGRGEGKKVPTRPFTFNSSKCSKGVGGSTACSVFMRDSARSNPDLNMATRQRNYHKMKTENPAMYNSLQARAEKERADAREDGGDQVVSDVYYLY